MVPTTTPTQKTPVEPRVETQVETSVIASGKTSGKILTYLGRRPNATIPDLAKLLGITERSVERNLQKLQKDTSAARRLGLLKICCDQPSNNSLC
ncbi:MAG: winged helix-turn-helix domain-containing protein [Rhodocyclaceae bacterium]|nr:winged helix-turn-helix domain-containing protein [Rhodocyclaceae bacterium]